MEMNIDIKDWCFDGNINPYDYLCFKCVYIEGKFREFSKRIIVPCAVSAYPVCRTAKKHQCKDFLERRND
jgi:hypothetical protein